MQLIDKITKDQALLGRTLLTRELFVNIHSQPKASGKFQSKFIATMLLLLSCLYRLSKANCKKIAREDKLKVLAPEKEKASLPR
jgi:hypothetical protein